MNDYLKPDNSSNSSIITHSEQDDDDDDDDGRKCHLSCLSSTVQYNNQRAARLPIGLQRRFVAMHRSENKHGTGKFASNCARLHLISRCLLHRSTNLTN